MHVLILSGLGGGGNNPLPLVLPIWIIVAIAYLIDLLVRFIKKRRQHHKEEVQDHEELFNDLITPIDHPDQNQI